MWNFSGHRIESFFVLTELQRICGEKSMCKLENQICEVRKVLTFYAQLIPHISDPYSLASSPKYNVFRQKGVEQSPPSPFPHIAIGLGRLKTLEQLGGQGWCRRLQRFPLIEGVAAGDNFPCLASADLVVARCHPGSSACLECILQATYLSCLLLSYFHLNIKPHAL